MTDKITQPRKKTGPKPGLWVPVVTELRELGYSDVEIAAKLGIKRTSLYRNELRWRHRQATPS